MNLPSLTPLSNSLNCAQRSIRPLLAGVPVSPTMRLITGRRFIKALKRLERWFLNDESSSTTTMSKSKGMALSSMSHCTFSRLMMYMSAFVLNASRRSTVLPTATEALSS